MSRPVHPSVPGRGQSVSASATIALGEDHTYEGKKPFVEARPLGVDEIPGLQEDYRNAACNALATGYDGPNLCVERLFD